MLVLALGPGFALGLWSGLGLGSGLWSGLGDIRVTVGDGFRVRERARLRARDAMSGVCLQSAFEVQSGGDFRPDADIDPNPWPWP